jgi:hypothetical protein
MLRKEEEEMFILLSYTKLLNFNFPFYLFLFLCMKEAWICNYIYLHPFKTLCINDGTLFLFFVWEKEFN